MKCIIYIIVLFFTIHISLSAQQADTWYAFSDLGDGELIGFKDTDGEVRISPRFIGMMEGRKFDDILAAIEVTDSILLTYYLTKSGRIVGRDSLFSFDNMPDCENEGFIRFHDKQTDQMGVFNRNGDIVIPAGYNALTKVMNGLVAGLKNAEKKYWHGHGHDEHAGCNHYSWEGGESVLLDTTNRILVEDFNYEGVIDYYSLQITDSPIKDSCRLNFKSVDGTYYSFVHIEKEFQRWLDEMVLTDISEEKLLTASYDSITWTPSGNWEAESKYDFIKRNFNILSDRLLLMKQSEFDYYIIPGGLNQFIYDSKEFERYYDNCGDPKDWQYPVISLILNHRNDNRLTQDHFDFLRTDKGYRLLSVSLRSGYLEAASDFTSID